MTNTDIVFLHVKIYALPCHLFFEINITDVTSKTWFIFVCRSVVFKLPFPCKRLRILSTGMVSLLYEFSSVAASYSCHCTCMNSQVLLQVTLVTEWFFTYRTFESAFTCVHKTVMLQVVFLTKAFYTSWALEVFTPALVLMCWFIALVFEEYSTCWTPTFATFFRFWRFLCHLIIIKKVMSIYH